MVVDDSVTEDLSVEAVTAGEGADFQIIGRGPIVFSPLERSRVINAPISRDLISEGEEIFRLHLSNPGNASLGSITIYTVRIAGGPE